MQNKPYALGFVGMGNMASSILAGILNHNILDRKDIFVCEVDYAKLQKMFDNGIATTNSTQELLANCDYVILAVKPQSFKQINFSSAPRFENKAIISIMAGITTEEIGGVFGHDRICRIMPNMPIMVGQGMSCLTFKTLSDLDKDFITGIFASIGAVMELTEDKFDAVTSISGSGPAYIYYFINAMINSGVQNGLTYEEARMLTINTFYGATRLLESSRDIPIDTLIDNVCSKGGTTIEAINVFRNNNLDDTIKEGINKCFLRSKELSKRENG